MKKVIHLNKTFKLLGVIIGLLWLISSCQVINSNALFQIPKGENFTYDSLPLLPSEDYKLGPGDRFSFLFSTNNGERIILNQTGLNVNYDESTTNNANLTSRILNNQIDYLVRQNGTVELPKIGVINVENLSLIALEDSLEKILKKEYIDPFVQVRLTNQRVLVFPGRGKASVVYLQNTNTSLLEAIALSGGINNDGKAYSIKLMRRIKGKNKREIYKIDLSKIDGIYQAEMIVQANDYIYIDYKPRYASQTLIELGPWLSLITTSLAVIAIFR